MPVYNTPQDWLRAAINSILSQSLTEFELIIVDNGCDEVTRRVLMIYDDSRIVRIRLENNAGAAVARNKAMEIARGEFLAFMDSDDISLPQRLEKQLSYMQQHPEIGVLGTQANSIVHGRMKRRTRGAYLPGQLECNLLLVGCVLSFSSTMVRREVPEKAKVQFRCFPAEDYVLWLDLLGRTKFGMLDEFLVGVRDKKGNPHLKQQWEISRRIQEETLIDRFGVQKDDAELFLDMFYALRLPDNESRLLEAMNHIVEQLRVRGGYEEKYAKEALRWAVRKVYYRTGSLRGQWHLLKSPLGEHFHPGLLRRLWCLVTRVLFLP